ncbi:hypothetical protein SXCC_03222 [Gluconacetobacter sp. SXCC-1]|nr:hypothetical protein SXCC_03222 [Gluconacetobacter sp. SXCC-1]
MPPICGDYAPNAREHMRNLARNARAWQAGPIHAGIGA